MKPKTVAIVDDESAARYSLKEVIDTFNELEVIVEVSDGKSAIEQIMVKRPDIVFLDIEMPEVTGFVVAKATSQMNYQLVFLTAYENYALRAFDTNAIDYLVKPARPELIARSIRKILQQEMYALEQSGNTTSIHRLLLSDGNQQRLLSHDHINYIESIGRYRRVHLTESGSRLHNTDTIISDMTLDTFCEQLPRKVFYRLHRSYIINSERMLELKSQSRRHFVRMAGTDTKIPVSRNFLNRLKRSIKISC
ncbi:LytTR family DNA-binding domain-containing protein [Microbulbifer sp. THAF38]|uniref:LytR/AlgR family response regulator transcription factor n=1 Tax=Microbulbifer sp. THAF38 TaxID=2587856 RepID=UPI001269661A|nr:LytTR family DNA-binding domain-containing protein [Microbulbifer sp. THAF38]QFT54366.1 Transcriptional regulatory protein YehT [Microbulbifer sp. THAF38]